MGRPRNRLCKTGLRTAGGGDRTGLDRHPPWRAMPLICRHGRAWFSCGVCWCAPRRCLPKDVWADIGLERSQAFSRIQPLVTYGQHSADDRWCLARGGYHWRQAAQRFQSKRGTSAICALFVQRTVHNLGCVLTRGAATGMASAFAACWLTGAIRPPVTAVMGRGVGANSLGRRTLSADLILDQQSELTTPALVIGQPSARAGGIWNRCAGSAITRSCRLHP
jgi:hypothetical protein